MTYEEALHELYHQLPVFQKSGGLAYKPGLERTLKLLNANGNAHNDLNFVHIAGTNGKGSVSHFLCSVLMESGYTCGLFTSPHLIDFRERIKVNGELIDKTFICEFVEKNKPLFDSIKPSFFEATTTLAFNWFKTCGVDIVILETGMGGNLDSTNVVTPIVSVITNIGLDHSQFLGDTIEKIAFEKAGIIKNTIPVVVGEANEIVKNVIIKKANETASKIYFVESFKKRKYESELSAAYQDQNIQTVRIAANEILKNNFVISEKTFSLGIKNVIKNTGLRGRYETISTKPRIICDAAHNQPGMHALVNQINLEKFNQLHIVIGMAKDKDVINIIKELPKNAIYYFTQSKGERSLPVNELSAVAYSCQRKGNIFENVAEALNAAKKQANKNDLILVTGSFFVLAEVLQNSN